MKVNVGLAFAMVVQLVALVWYISGLVHDLEHMKQTLSAQDEMIRLIDQDVDDLWYFCTFTENKWAESYTDDMVYERVRLAGIDTPESRTKDLAEKHMGLEAKVYLTDLLNAADDLIVKTEKDGKFGRMLGWFYNNKFSIYSINEQLIDEGYAWKYDGGSKKKDLQELIDRRKKYVKIS